MKIKHLVLSLAGIMACTAAVAQIPVTTKVWDNSQAHCAIPAITRTADGNLYAVSDYRYNNGADIGGGQIDIRAKKSTDNGLSWGAETKIVSLSGTSGFNYAHGDAAIVTDRETGEMLLLCASGNKSCTASTVNVTKTGNKNNYKYSLNTSNAILIGKATSSNNGTQWTQCTDISQQIYGLYNQANANTYSNNSNFIDGVFFASGRICQSRFIKVGTHYRLYAALWSQKNGSMYGNLVVYSDDFGSTWKALGGITTNAAAPQGNEAKIEELPNGNVLISSRGDYGRYFNIFTYTDKENAKGSWGTAVFSSSSNQGGITTCRGTNGEILIMPCTRTSDNKQVYVALQSVPMSSIDRAYVGIYYKELASVSDFDSPSDFQTGWSKYIVTNTYSAYSTMVLDNKGFVAFLYESNATTGTRETYDIMFNSLPIATITGNKYTYNADLNNDAFLKGEDVTTSPGFEKVYTIKNRIKVGNTTTDRYMWEDIDPETNLPKLTFTEANNVPNQLDKRYYWVISKDPDGDHYYISNFNGDGYLGIDKAESYYNQGVFADIPTCTDDYKKEFLITGFPKDFGTKNSTITGVGIQFKHTDGDPRVVAVSNRYNDNSGKNQIININWSDHNTPGEVMNAGNNIYWSTDFIFEEVPYTEAVNSQEVFGTTSSPTQSGYPVKFTRHDDSYTTMSYEDYNQYATLKLPFATIIPAGVTAYKINSLTPVSDNEVKLEKYLESTENDLKVLPRETPVLLCKNGQKNDGNIQETLFFHPTLARTITATGFAGTLGKTTFSSDANDDNYYDPASRSIYFLSKKNGRVAFYWLNDRVMNANKAFYNVPANKLGQDLTFNFSGNTSAITLPATTPGADSNAPIYDLQGRRVSAPAKGIYIKGGKKYVVR